MSIQTLAGIRDRVRRLIYVVPAIDVNAGPSGQPNPSQPNPDNHFMNDAINRGVSLVNRKARLAPMVTASVVVAAPAAATRGPYFVDFSGQVSTLQVQEIRLVLWNDILGNTALQPVNWYGVDYASQPFLQDAPGQPQQFFVHGYEVAIVPAPVNNGTLTIEAGTSLPHYAQDTDSITTIPEEYQHAWEYYAAGELSAAQTVDIEAADRVKPYMELSLDVIKDVMEWRDGFRALYQPSIQGGARQAPAA